MTDDQRYVVKQLYPNKRWANRVNKMSDAQVFAIYKANQEKLEKKSKEKR